MTNDSSNEETKRAEAFDKKLVRMLKERFGPIVVVGTVVIALGVLVSNATIIWDAVSRIVSRESKLNLDEDQPFTPWLSHDEYGNLFPRMKEANFYSSKLEGRYNAEKERKEYRALFRPIPGAFWAFRAMSDQTFKSKDEKFSAQGFSLMYRQYFHAANGELCIQAVWLEGNSRSDDGVRPSTSKTN